MTEENKGLVDMPKQLKDKKFRFIKIIKNTKRPLERWLVKNYDFESLNADEIYGVICGPGELRGIDVDNKEINLEIDTLTIQTPRGKHYIVISDYDKNHVLDCGEYRAKNMYLIGPNSIREGKKYEITKDCEIKRLSKEEILTLLSPYMKGGKFNIK